VGHPSDLDQYPHTIADRLVLYVQGIVESENIEEALDRLTQENASLKQQLTELRQRESTYLSIIAQPSTAYPLPPESKENLLASLERQRAIIPKNLCTLQEQKAHYGLSPPLHIINAIDQAQEDLKSIENTIAYLKPSITEMK